MRILILYNATIGGCRHTIFSQARPMTKHEAKHCLPMEDCLVADMELVVY
jgi:hypothetical protein